MIEQVARGIFRIHIPLPDNPLRELNSYYIQGTDRDLLIDTGFRCPECQKALQESLAILQSDSKRRDVLLTHAHSDHSGMADEFAGKNRHVYMHETDLDYLKKYQDGPLRRSQIQHYVHEGFPEILANKVFEESPEGPDALPVIDERFCGLKDGAEIQMGDRILKVISVPGHTPGNVVLWIENENIMFTGDHVLFDITPNITAWETMEDALGEYLDSLKKVKDYDVCQALPAHRGSGNYQQRIENLLSHHAARVNEVLKVVCRQPGLTAYEIAGHMTWSIRSSSWNDFPLVQKWFAVGECISHLDYLRKRGYVSRTQSKETWRYFPLKEKIVDI